MIQAKDVFARNVPWLRLFAAPLVVLAFLLLPPSAARAQCTGDCNGDSQVDVDELVLGIDLGLVREDVGQCAAFDANSSGSVEIDEIVSGVFNALEGCPAPTTCGDGNLDPGEECDNGRQCDDGTTDCTGDASTCIGIVNEMCEPRNGDGCQANCKLPFCGDSIVDNLTEGETCDDGNNDEGFDDTCPADCRVESCTPSGSRLLADIEFTTDTQDLLIGALEIFLRYPDGVVSIPGSNNSPPVLQRVTSPSFSITPNDVDFGVTGVLFDQTFLGVEPGTAFTIDFDTCEGAAAPSSDDFTCIVGTASDPLLNDVTDQVSCSVALP